jgi:hypothetical protein
MADNKVRVTKIGAALVIVDDGVSTTKSGAYAEILGDPELRVTSSGAMAEFEATELRVTSSGAVVEILYSTPVTPSTPVVKYKNSGASNILYGLPELVTGYALDPVYSFWQVVLPEETVNMIEISSWETPFLSAAVTNVWQANGSLVYAMVDNPSYGSIDGRTVATLTGNTGAFWYEAQAGNNYPSGHWTFSAWIKGNPGDFFQLQICDDVPPTYNVLAQIGFVIKHGGWHRYWVSCTTVTPTPIVPFINVPDAANVSLATDAWQVEKKSYPTTYANGAMQGFYEDREQSSFRWEGAWWGSRSVRSRKTRTGGRVVSLYDEVGFLTTAIIGLGMTPVDVDASVNDGAAFYSGTTFEHRDFTIAGRIYACSFEELQERRNFLIQYLRPDSIASREPLKIIYSASDGEGAEITAPAEIRASYTSGLEGNITNYFQENVGLQFSASPPEIRSVVHNSATIAAVNQLWTTPAVLCKPVDYINSSFAEVSEEWTYFSAGNLDGALREFDWRENSQQFVVSGAFTTFLTGVALQGIARYDYSSSTLTDPSLSNPAGVFDTSGRLAGINIGSGDIAMMGDFTVKGVTTMRGAAQWNSVTGWAELATGLTITGVMALGTMVEMPNGDIFCFGQFLLDGTGLVTLTRCAKWIKATNTWSGLAPVGPLNGLNQDVYEAILGNDGMIYLIGSFTQDAAGNTLNYVCQYDPINDVFNAMPGFPTFGRVIAQGKDNFIYALDNSGSSTTIYRWNGSTWTSWFTIDTGGILDIDVDSEGVVHAVGNFGSWLVPDLSETPYNRNYIKVANGAFQNGEVVQEDIPASYIEPDGVEIDNLDRIGLRIGWPVVGPHTDLTSSIRQTVTNIGTAETHPTIYVQGPGRVYHIRNEETGATINFRSDFILEDLEILCIDLSQSSPQVYTTLRTNAHRFLLTGSSGLRQFKLLPGDNKLSIMIGSAAAGSTEMWMVWPLTYHSLDPIR